MAVDERPGSGRLAAWSALVLVLAALNYAGRFVGGKPPRDVLYQWGTAIGGVIQYALILTVVLWISRGLPKRAVLALRRPASWGRAAGLALATLIGIAVLNAVLDPLLHAGREQGLTPSRWESSHAAAFVANFLVIVLGAPLVEEITFRGLGFRLLERFGRGVAILLVGIAFGLAHGLVEALPILIAFGSALAYLRSRTHSVYPGMLLHGSFNAVALILAVTL